MIFLIADTHSRIDRLRKHIQDAEKIAGRSLTEEDVLICLGDLLGSTKKYAKNKLSKLAADKGFIQYIETKPFKVLSIRGNHDSYNKMRLLKAEDVYMNGLHMLKVASNIFFLDDAAIYDLPLDGRDYKFSVESSDISDLFVPFDDPISIVSFEDPPVTDDSIDKFNKGDNELEENPASQNIDTISVLCLGGASGHLHRFSKNQMKMKLRTQKKYLELIHLVETIEVDYVLSHDGPTSKIGSFLRFIFGSSPTNEVLQKISENIIFYDWYFGHHHMDLDPSRGYHCIFRRTVPLSVPDKNQKRIHEYGSDIIEAYAKSEIKKISS